MKAKIMTSVLGSVVVLAACTRSRPIEPSREDTAGSTEESAAPPTNIASSEADRDGAHVELKGASPEASPRWRPPGHQQILRQAVALVDRKIGKSFYATGLSELIAGNDATDNAGERLQSFYGWKNKLALLDYLMWHYDPRMQNLHFLRNHEPRVQTAKEACLGSRERIKNAALSGLWRYTLSKRDFYYLLGHATHIVQDSFAPAHARRAGPLLRDIVDVCIFDTFGTSGANACEHTPAGDDVGAARGHADAAIRATVGLLYSIYQHLPGNQTTSLHGFLDSWFVEPSDQYSGYFACTFATPSCPDGKKCCNPPSCTKCVREGESCGCPSGKRCCDPPACRECVGPNQECR